MAEIFQDFIEMKTGTVVVMIITTLLLPTADVFTDILFTLKLFTGYGHKESHPKYGSVTLVPLIMSLIGQTIQWHKTETREQRSKMKTLPLLLLQIYPQWIALRVIYYGKIKKDRRWRDMKKEFDVGISHIGNHC